LQVIGPDRCPAFQSNGVSALVPESQCAFSATPLERDAPREQAALKIPEPVRLAGK
jgi:hypothetical protein